MKFFKRSAYFPKESKWLELTENWAKDYFTGGEGEGITALVATQEEADLLIGLSYVWGFAVKVETSDLSKSSDANVDATYIQMRIEM